ncbi:uncharacterized protein LOC129236117 [Anastrepha obliqua]|uniref:uncharacterized protein LOC129236117 n=1 Tax=Anastrepha obliqua TaxID=95512 RepID=UPI00240994BC|nr:uncharacterized protein LOC129236117 [Anastrepha obliqua]
MSQATALSSNITDVTAAPANLAVAPSSSAAANHTAAMSYPVASNSIAPGNSLLMLETCAANSAAAPQLASMAHRENLNAGIVYGTPSAPNTAHTMPSGRLLLQRNPPISPAHSINSVGSQGLRRRAELIQERSEILRQREALLREEHSFLDRIDAMGFDDDLDDGQCTVPRFSTSAHDSGPHSTQIIQPPANFITPFNIAASGANNFTNTGSAPHDVNLISGSNAPQPGGGLTASVLQGLLDRIQSLEQQVRTYSTLNRGYSPPQPQPAQTTLPTAGHVNSLSFGASTSRRLSRDQIASRNSLAKELPKYDGKPTEWPLFYAAYNQSTEVCGFSDDENLIRLRQALEGPARNAVKNLLLHSSCVPQIIATLQMRFGRPELIISVLQRQIYELPSPSESQLESIVDFAVEVQNICATMSASGLTSHLNNPDLEQKLVSKLPGLLPAYWGMHKQSLPICNLQHFSDWLFLLAQGANSVIVPKESTKVRKRGAINYHFNAVRCIVCEENCSDVSKCVYFKGLTRSQKWGIVRKLKLCHRCLKGHPTAGCKSTAPCNVNSCTRNHHPLLHNAELAAKDAPNNGKGVTTMRAVNVNMHNVGQGSTIFRVLPVVLHSGERSVSTYAFIDDGSSLTLIDEELLNKLNIKGTPQPLCLRWTGDTHRYEDESVVVDLAISAKNGNKKFGLKGVHTVKKLDLPLQSINAAKLQSKFQYLKRLPLESYSNAVPQLLIGLNNAALGSPIKSLYGRENEPIAEKSKLGWTLKGQASSTNHDAAHPVFHICDCSAQAELVKITKSYICLDNLGVSAKSSALMSKEDEFAMVQLQQHTVRVGNRYRTSLLWKHPKMQLPNSLPMALFRAKCLLKKMQRDPNLAEVLQQKIDDYIQKGYARRMTPVDSAVERYWYLPVFAVINPNKPGKVRLVWDAAAKVDGISLNTMLLKGPDLTTPLLSVLFKFRQKRIAMSADIAEMFHQVQVREQDQNFMRFLWYEQNANEPTTFVMTVMTFGATCSPSCAQYVKNKNAEEFREEFPGASQCIIENHYVDDMLVSVDTEEEAIKLARDVRHVHAMGGFHIRNFLSNSSRVLAALNGSPTDALCLDFENEQPTEKVLGMWWVTSSDHFAFRVSSKYKNSDLLLSQRRPTKREVLSLVMTIYDPIGLIGFYVVYAKVILQEIWRAGCDWDDPIPDDQFAKWLRWIKLIPKIENLRIPRSYARVKFDDTPKIELHTFVDASESSYAAVCYLRYSHGNSIDCMMIASKTRVAPLKLLSIPRLELKAALLGARLAKHIIESHSIHLDSSVYWSDSRTVLAWLYADHRRYKQFVAFRVSEILELTDVSEWRWVPTAANVADEATKWNGDPDFSNDSRWFSGPSFLYLPCDEWPVSNGPQNISTEELRPQFIGAHCRIPEQLLMVPKPERFSTWDRLLRATATTLYCARIWLSVVRDNQVLRSVATTDDFRKAENFLWRKAQQDIFNDSIISLSVGKAVDKSSKIFKLSPYLDDDGVLRIDGRVKIIGRTDPVLLPNNHHITNLIINHFHVKYHHVNSETVVNEIRQHFWILKLRIAVNRIRRSCQVCKNRSAQPRPPRMACLPTARIAQFCRPFSYVGVDYFGPLLVTVKRSTEKRYGVLFTCLTTRAVHLEVAYSLSTDSCILAVRNFMARRGSPLEIWSDNGTNFKGAERELKSAFTLVDQNRLTRTFTSAATNWHFIPPASPHMGGAWERLVRSVKDVLQQILTSNCPNDEILHAALMEVEMTVNSRPLTYIPIDHEEEEALTPNHFLLGSSNGVKPIAEPVTEGVLMRRNWRTSQNLADAFWRRWVTEYLPTITRRTKWFEDVKAIKVGDIAYIVDPNNPRNSWPKGKVIGVRTSADGRVRSATLQTICGIYERPAAKIAVLDLKGSVHPNRQDIPGGSVTNSLAARSG